SPAARFDLWGAKWWPCSSPCLGSRPAPSPLLPSGGPMPERSTSTRSAPAGTSVGGTRHGVAPEQLRASTASIVDQRLAPAFDALADGGLKAVSVDIFDTLLWRKVAEPVDAFVLLGERLAADGMLADDVTPAVFAKLRAAAERRARDVSRAGGRVEI